ncbi:putative beta-lactamase domain protein [Mycobacterium xenopi 4042]|uniref:Putative beta-lactamase domain protein n=1 Tax=Mycobacterium xenopi 4042 TaxID=1299334 RepID=X8DJH9_MYCXE|nr:putative beta-lactamase domain protein [Mycobacterium xenopi 4042]
MTTGLHTAVDEIADGMFRLSTWVPGITEHGFTFNQFLLTGEQPFLFHCGTRQLFPLVSEAIGKVIPLERLRWISFAHVEADECGAVNLLLDAAPNAEVIHSPLACMVSLNDLCDRRPSSLRKTRHTTSAGTDCASSPPRTCRTTGKAHYGLTKPPPHCWPGSAHPHRSMSCSDRIRLRRNSFGGRSGIPRHRIEHEPGTNARAARAIATHHVGPDARRLLRR